jgi:hypothetical protein
MTLYARLQVAVVNRLWARQFKGEVSADPLVMIQCYEIDYCFHYLSFSSSNMHRIGNGIPKVGWRH